MAKEQDKNSKKKKGHSRSIIFGIIIGICCSAISLAIGFTNVITRMELSSLNYRFQNRPEINLAPEVGYVNLDNASCDLAGSWPWSRNYHATLVNTLTFYNAQAAGYDVFFSEVSNPVSPPHMKITDDTTEDELMEIAETLYRDHDETFKESLETSNVFLGEFLKSPEQNGVSKDPKDIADYIKEHRPLLDKAKTESIELVEEHNTFSYKKNTRWDYDLEKTVEAVAPIKKLGEAARGTGFEQIIPDNITGTVYEYPMFLEYDNQVHPALGLLIVSKILGIDFNETQVTDSHFIFTTTKPFGEFQPGTFSVPINKKMRMMMNWSGPYFETFFHINFKMLSFYHAYNESKRIVKDKKPDFKNALTTIDFISQTIQNENWVPKEEAPTIATEIVLAQLVSDLKNEKRDVIISKLKQLNLDPKIYEKVTDSILLSKEVIANLNSGDLSFIKDNMSKPEYLNFRSGLYSKDKYPGLSAKHQSEIVRNILAFKSWGKLELVAPYYFPPCLHSHVNGELKDISPTMINQKVFMIGLEGEGTIDLNPQPYEKSCAMVALHANAINTFLTQQFIGFKNSTQTIIISLIIALMVGIYSQLLSTKFSFPITLIILGIYAYYCQSAFNADGTWVEFVTPALAMIITYFMSVGLQLYLAFKEKQKMKGMFGKMVSPDVLKVMSDNPDLFSLTGKRQACTSYFSSMENFAAINKGVTPQEMTSLLSDYLTPASQIITSYTGYIDKYEGHIIMADFGVPIPTLDHTQQCLYSSIETQVDLEAFKTYIYSRFGKKVNTSMGVNTGFVSAGNMGSDRKMQYTIMGDTVNTAARFRPANWIYDYLGSIIIGEMTYPVVKDIVEVRNLDKLLLKGKLKPVNIYEVMGWNRENYLATRGQIDVTETLQMCWAKHCPPEKIYGYGKMYAHQFERTEHPLCTEISAFFKSKIDISAQLTGISIKQQIMNTKNNFYEYRNFYQQVTSNEIPVIPSGPWKEKLKEWGENIEHALKNIDDNFQNNIDAEQSHRDLTEILEKVEALDERLEFSISLCPELDKIWDNIREFVSSDFTLDEENYGDKYTTLYQTYENDALAFVETVSPRMEEYHQMMALIGSRTEKESKGCEIYEEALQLHWDRKWDDSIARFNDVLEYLPNDKAALSFIKRVKNYKVKPPGDDWQGQFAQTKK